MGRPFKNSADLINRIESLPNGGPRWKGKWITLPDAPKDPQLLLYRDPVECLEWLEANPDFEGEKDYVPRQEFVDKEFQEQSYSEMATGNCWAAHQARATPEDVTTNPVIITTDSTHLTNFSGDKKVILYCQLVLINYSLYKPGETYVVILRTHSQ